MPLIIAIKLGNIYTVRLSRPHPLQNFFTPSRSLLEFLCRKKHRDVPRVSAIITNDSPPPHRQSTPGASCELPPSRGPSPSHQIMSQTRHARRTSFPQQTFTPPACHPVFVKSYKGIVCQIAPFRTPYQRAENFAPKKCRARLAPAPKSRIPCQPGPTILKHV